jgi:hypothetical protein
VRNKISNIFCSLFLLILLLLVPQGGNANVNIVMNPSCETIFISASEQLLRSRTEMLTRDKGSRIERRIKILTTGERADAAPNIDAEDIHIDSADPSLVMPIYYPDGAKKYRINFSGMRYIEAENVKDFFSGGIFKVQQSRGFYSDGTEMLGPYHNASWPWDVVIYQNNQGKNIALGGVMRQPGKGQLPSVGSDNITRSRWWGDVQFTKNSQGEFEEHIIWRGPINDFNQNFSTPPSWVFHGYGGTLLSEFNPRTGEHELVKNEKGNYTLFYERVTEEKVGADGQAMPWITTMFSREMDPSMTHTVGTEFPVTNLISPVSKTYFKALKRGSENEQNGFLAEGGNVLIEKNSKMLIKAWSANDFVRKYGIYLDYLPGHSNPQTMYTPVTDAGGELIDFANTMGLREIMNATWLGRPQLIYAPDGKLWLEFHFVPKESIPPGAPVEGWPSAKDFVKYGRITAIAPVRIEMINKQPHLKLDLDGNH